MKNEVRSGHNVSYLKIDCVVFSVSFQAVALRTKIAMNHRFFFIQSELSGQIQPYLTWGGGGGMTTPNVFDHCAKTL